MSEPDEGQHFKDLWAWADDEGDERFVAPVDPSLVLAVMVVRDAEPWLLDQLAAIEASTHRPGRIIAVDAGSSDDSLVLLREAKARGVLDEVLTFEAATTFADAVHFGVGDTRPDWLWILHDDSAPEPEALAMLLEAATSADLIFPKLLAPRRRNYPDVIVECGQSISRGGYRVGVPEEGDVDQHQLEPAATLGGSTAGMLVRGDLWRELGGLAPELPGHRDGVDFGWRANLGQWRVVTAPDAALVHRQAGRTQERPLEEHPHSDDRLAALRIMSAHGVGGARLAICTWARALGFLLSKAPARAKAELRALRRFRVSKDQVALLKARIPEGDPADVADLLAPKYWVIRNALGSAAGAIADRYRDFASDTSIDELTSDEYGHGPTQRALVAPGVLLVVAFLLAGLGASWRLWGSFDLAGGGLLPAPTSLSALWDAALTSAMPALGIAATLGTLVFGQLPLLGLLLVLLGPLATALSANSCLRQLGCQPGLSAGGAGLWGASVLLLGLPSVADVSGMVVGITLPLLIASWHRMLTVRTTGAEVLRAPAAAAFWLVVLAAFWPIALLLATALGVILLITRRGTLTQWIVAILPVWALLVPWLAQFISTPGRLLTGVDPLAWPPTPPAGLGLLIGRIVDSGIPLWISVTFFTVLAAVAVWGIVRVPAQKMRVLLTAAIAVALLAGAGLSRLALPIGAGHARALLSPWALLAIAGMIAAIMFAEHPRQDKGHRTISGVLVPLLVAFAICVWPLVGMRGSAQTGAASLPGYVRAVIDSPRDSRALMLERVGDQVQWNVVDHSQPMWGSAEHLPTYGFDEEFLAIARSIASGQVPDDLADQLSALGVSHVWMSAFEADQVAAMSNVEGLTSAPASDSSTVFTVVGLVSRANVVEDGSVTPVVDGQVPQGGAKRQLTVSQAGPLEVRVGGQVLERVEGETSTYALGSRAGELTYGAPRRWMTFAWSVFVLAVVALLALPTFGTAGMARRAGEEFE